MLTREQALEYVSRWTEVARVQREELRAMTPEQKLADLAELMEWFDVPETPHRRLGVEQVRRSWAILRARHGID